MEHCDTCTKYLISPEDALLDMKNHTKIIGSGGFGLVKEDVENHTVIKLIYDRITSGGKTLCDKSKDEFFIHNIIYNSTLRLEDLYDFQIPIPLGFYNFGITSDNAKFPCYYKMSKINHVDKNGLYHVIFRNEISRSINRIVGKIYQIPVGPDNPSRGFFATAEYIKNHFDVSLNQLAELMGALYFVITFIAEYDGTDIEYVLGRNDSMNIVLTFLDFGECNKINFDTFDLMNNRYITKIYKNLVDAFDMVLYIDIYFPNDDNPEFPDFVSGYINAYKYYQEIIPEYKNIFAKLIIEEYLNKKMIH